MKKILIILFIIVTVTTLASCSKDQFRSVVSGDYVYSSKGVPDSRKNVAIIALSETGKTKKTIVFPATLDGYRVFRIGTYDILAPSGPLVFENAENIYFNFGYSTSRVPIQYNVNENAELNIYVGYRFPDSRLYTNSKKILNSKIFVKKEYLDELIKVGHEDRGNFIPANVVYYLGDELDDVFFVDDADGAIVNVMPPVPRKDGHGFVGWYKDLEGTIEWDFENDIVPEKEYDEEGNYIFKETKIYAKWQATN